MTPLAMPRPWEEWPASQAAGVAGVLTDIDDTLTCDGVLTPQARSALSALQRHGLPAIAITGRPLGWSETLTRDWPLDAVVAENGGVALFRRGGQVHIEYAQDPATRQDNASRLADVAARVLREVPGSALAADSAGRVTDIAVDHSEHARLSAAQIDAAATLMRAAGMTVTVSSIHINGWFGDHSKLTGARWAVAALLGRELDDEVERWIYVGDSTNDQVMFARFPLSVGVANLLHFAERLAVWPRYLTRGERGLGFAEVVQRLLQSRSSPRP